MPITEREWHFACPGTNEPLVATVDVIGRMTVARPDGALPGEAAKDTDEWIKKLHGRAGYVAVYSDRSARVALGKAGVLRLTPGSRVAAS